MNLKSILSVLLWSVLAGNAMALEGDSLIDSLSLTQKKISSEISFDNILVWEARLDSADQITTKVLTKKGFLFEYQCTERTYGLSCKEENYSETGESLKIEKNHDYIMKGSVAALEKFIATLKSKKLDGKSIQSMKVWPEEAESHGGHSHGTNVWTKFEYKIGDKVADIYVVCHTHGNEDKLFCHYQKSGSKEPSLK